MFTEFLNDMDDIYKNVEECNQSQKRKMLILIDLTTGMRSNKKGNPVVTELLQSYPKQLFSWNRTRLV